MKARDVHATLFLCVLAMPVFGQQKTYDWRPGNDETVRLDPGYYYAGPAYQSGGGTRTVRVDIDAQQPVTLAMVSAQAWNDATQHSEAMDRLNFLCVREHVMQATYTCDLPWGVPMRLLVRDQRGQRGFAGMGEVTGGRDYDRDRARRQPDARAGDSEEDRERERRERARALESGIGAVLGGRSLRRFFSPNDVHIGYYDWTCTASCDLPDPPRPKLFDWVPADTVVDRLDPGEFFHGQTMDFASSNVAYHFDLEARWPVTVAVVPKRDWYDAIAQHFGKNLDNINYVCIQRHVVRTSFNCKIDFVHDSLFMVVLDERPPLPADRYPQPQSQAGGPSTSQNAAQPASQPASRAGAATTTQTAIQKPGQPAAQPAAQSPALVERTASLAATTTASTQNAAYSPGSNWSRPFLAPNEIRRLGYVWRCVDACDQPDYAWGFQLSQSYQLTNALKLYGGAVIPDHDGEQVSIRVKSPVPMAVAMLRAKTAGQLVVDPTKFESTIENSTCSQRGVQESSFQCTFNVADGPQSLVLMPEAGAEIPQRKKADVAVQAFKCVDNCRGPSFAWVNQAHEKYRLTPVLKVYGGIAADYDGAQFSIKIKSPVPMAAVVLPAKQAGQLYGKPDTFESEAGNSSCKERNIQDSTFQCTFDVADGAQSLVILPEPGNTLPRDKKAEVEIQAKKCVARCDSLSK